jgi:hypothetical protein
MIPLQKDSGQSQIDFLVGFSIFILSLVVVATMVPSLLVGLQRTTAIDYDAVAYRTAVVLVEDPGEPFDPDTYGQNDRDPWDFILLDNLRMMKGVRFGLAQSRQTPNILSPHKIERFFDPALTPTDFKNYLIFGDIEYGFNVTLVNLYTGTVKSVGSPYPNGGYGYIRRYVKIRNYTNATVDNSTHLEFNLSERPNPDTATRTFDILLDWTYLYRDQAKMPYSPAYVIDPTRDPLVINITGLRGHLNRSDWSPDPLAVGLTDWTNYTSDCPEHKTAPTYATLKSITFLTSPNPPSPQVPVPVITDGTDPNVVVYYGEDVLGDGHDQLIRVWDNDADHYSLKPMHPVTGLPGVRVNNSVNIEVKGLDDSYMYDGQGVVIRLTFEEPTCDTLKDHGGGGALLNPPHTLLSGTFVYDYNVRNVTQPALSPGILEVAVW